MLNWVTWFVLKSLTCSKINWNLSLLWGISSFMMSVTAWQKHLTSGGEVCDSDFKMIMSVTGSMGKILYMTFLKSTQVDNRYQLCCGISLQQTDLCVHGQCLSGWGIWLQRLRCVIQISALSRPLLGSLKRFFTWLSCPPGCKMRTIYGGE